MAGLLLALCLWAPLARAQAFQVPANEGWVTDRAGMLQPAEERALEALMESYAPGSGQDVALLTLPDLGGRPLEEVALATARAWKIGDRESSSGVLLVVSRAERELRIEVGRGLEGKLTDSIAGRIIRDVIVPEFRAEHFAAGLRKGVEAIHAALGGDYGPIERSPASRRNGLPLTLVLVVGVILLNLARRRRQYRSYGSSALPWILASQMGRGRSGGFGSFGGFGGGGRSGGGGFRGFGGGGGFSGGGASGRW